MFPLELRLILFEPLLPNEILYLYMAEKLEAHTVNKTQFPRLTVLANIPPESISQSWLRFLKQCLKRGCALSEATIANFFNISAQEVPKDLLGNYS